MQLVEENVTVRCYGSTRLTVAVNGSHTAWLLPSRNQKDQRAVECELRACHQSRLLEARRPGDMSQRAHISDLYSSTWKQLAYSITPPPGQGRDRRSSKAVYYLVPATGQILNEQGDLAEEQQQHQQWSVSSMGSWQGGEMMEPTVAEVVRRAQCGTRSPCADAVQAIPGNAVHGQHQTSKPLTGKVQVTVGTNSKREQPEQQQQGSTKRARLGVQYSSQAGGVSQAKLQQQLQLVIEGHQTMQDMLLYLLQQRGEMAFVQCMGHVISERGSSRHRAAMLIAALAKDKGNLLHSFLAAASSTNAKTAAAAVKVLATLSEVADAEQFLCTVLACKNGIELLSTALLDADSSPTVLNTSRDSCHRQYGGVASQPIRIFIEGAASQTIDGILRQCARLLANRKQPEVSQQSIQQQGATALLVLFLDSMRNIRRLKATMQNALRLIVQPLCIAAAASGPYQCQFWAGLLQILAYGPEIYHWDGWRQAPAAVQLITLLGQQRPEANVAAHLLHRSAAHASGLAVLVKHIPQMVSMLSSPGPPLDVVNLLCTLASRSTVGSNALLPYIDNILTVTVATHQQPGLHQRPPVSLLTSALRWFSALATDEHTRSELVATPQRMQQLVALLIKQHSGCRYGCPDVAAGVLSTNVISQLITNPTGTKLLATNQGLQSLADIVMRSMFEYQGLLVDTSVAADMITAVCVVAAAAAGDSKSEAASKISSALPAEDIHDCTWAWSWCHDLMACFCGRRMLGASELSSSLVVRVFGCLSSLAQLPAGAYHAAKHIQEFQTIISDLQSSNNLSKEDAQVCLQHLTEMKACVTKLQARLAATVVQLSADIQHALVTCAQVHQLLRRDCTKQQLQLLLGMQLRRVTAATAAMSKVDQLISISQLNCSQSAAEHATGGAKVLASQ